MDILKKVINCCKIGISDDDGDELKIKKSSVIIVPLITAPAGIIWGLLYFFSAHEQTALIPFFYTILTILNLLYFKKSKDIVPFQNIQNSLVLFVPFIMLWILGGFEEGSFVFIWAFFAPITALIYENKKRALYWFYSFILLIIISTIFDPYLAEMHPSDMSKVELKIFLILNVTGALSAIYYLIQYFINSKEKNAHDRLKKENILLQASTKELEETNHKLYFFANHDALTKLPNRLCLMENLKGMLSLAKRKKYSIALLFIDLDKFKNINDIYGHTIGDDTLKGVSNRISTLLREEDILARLGGDEFAVAINNVTDTAYLKNIAKRIIQEVNRDFSYIPNPSPLGVSIGISIFPKDAQDIDTLINYADSAMYKVKNGSKNDYLFYNASENKD